MVQYILRKMFNFILSLFDAFRTKCFLLDISLDELYEKVTVLQILIRLVKIQVGQKMFEKIQTTVLGRSFCTEI